VEELTTKLIWDC